MEQNQEPVNYTKLNLAEFNMPTLPEFNNKSASNTKKGISGSTFFFVFSVLAFVFSVSYYVQSTMFSTSSRAATPNTAMPIHLEDPTMTQKIVLPRTYKGENVSQKVRDDLAEDAKTIGTKFEDIYVKDNINKYYIYKDIIESNELDMPESDAITGEYVTSMENTIRNALVSKADFSYIQVRYQILNNLPALQQKYGDLDERAKAVIGRYEQLFVDPNYTVEQIIDISNKDEELMALTNNEANQAVTNYDGETNIIVLDPSFADFVFTQKENQVSDLHTLITHDGKAYGYIIIYPTRIEKRKYSSIAQIIKEYSPNFNY